MFGQCVMRPAWGSAARTPAAPGRRTASVDLQYAAVMRSRKPLLRNNDWGIDGQLVCSVWAYVSVKATLCDAHGFEQHRQSLVIVVYCSFVDCTDTVLEWQKHFASQPKNYGIFSWFLSWFHHESTVWEKLTRLKTNKWQKVAEYTRFRNLEWRENKQRAGFPLGKSLTECGKGEDS